MYLSTILIYSLMIHMVSAEDSPVITLPNGKIRGTVAVNYFNFTYFAYVGIPFARPPIGDLRFQPPQPVEDWKGILDVKKNSKKCFQIQDNSGDQTEDCLYLNVYTPAKPLEDTRLPVMVNIYGGSFVHGSANGISKAEFVVEKGIVVVTMNYRVGPLGFISTRDNVIPGNMGLKDQQLSLKWVKKNIHLFGGDPEKVTLMGQSAGAASVTYHILSPSSAGLFRAAIAQSSSALCNWAYQSHAVDTAYGIASMIDKSFTKRNTTRQLKELLLNADAHAIKATESKYHIFAPVIEVNNKEEIITSRMYGLLERGKINKVPLLIGMTSEESLAKVDNMESWTKYQKKFDTDPTYLVDENMGISDNEIMDKVAKEIKQIYTNSSFETDLAASIRFYSDDKFTRATIKYAELQAKYTDVYFYQFSYHGLMGNNSDDIKGAGRVKHAEDLRYFWSYYNDYDTFPEEDILTLRRNVELLTNFAKYLNPTPTKNPLLQNIIWTQMSSDHRWYLDIDKNLTIREDPKEYSYNTWVDIFENYAQKPYITF